MKTKLALAVIAVSLSVGCGSMRETAALETSEEDDEMKVGLIHAGPEPDADPGPGDMNWLSYVAGYDVSEVKLAALARKRSSSPLVQEFGTVKHERHQRSFNQASALASQGNAVLPDLATAIGERQFLRLDHIGSTLFDREFLALQVQLHREAAHAAAEAAARAPAGEVRQWASRAWGRWHRDEVWAGRLYSQVLTGHGSGRLRAGAEKIAEGQTAP